MLMQCGMREKSMGTVELGDMQGPVLEVLMEYLYGFHTCSCSTSVIAGCALLREVCQHSMALLCIVPSSVRHKRPSSLHRASNAAEDGRQPP